MGSLSFYLCAAVAQPGLCYISLFQFRFAWSNFDLLSTGDCKHRRCLNSTPLTVTWLSSCMFPCQTVTKDNPAL